MDVLISVRKCGLPTFSITTETLPCSWPTNPWARSSSLVCTSTRLPLSHRLTSARPLYISLFIRDINLERLACLPSDSMICMISTGVPSPTFARCHFKFKFPSHEMPCEISRGNSAGLVFSVISPRGFQGISIYPGSQEESFLINS